MATESDSHGKQLIMFGFNIQLSRAITLYTPSRIISLVPSQTELLYYLGLTNQVIGITKFCVHPKEWHQTKTRIGGTKTLNIESIKSLNPDLVIANKEENVREQIEDVAKDFPVWVSDVNTLEDAYRMIADVGRLVQEEAAAEMLVQKVKAAFVPLQTTNDKLQTAYLIWKDPYMTVGGDTFINDMLTKAGFENVFADRQRYPVITIEELLTANCELLLLSSEPYPFKQKHIEELQVHLPHTRIILVDGEIFSWYGSRLLLVPSYFKRLQEQLERL